MQGDEGMIRLKSTSQTRHGSRRLDLERLDNRLLLVVTAPTTFNTSSAASGQYHTFKWNDVQNELGCEIYRSFDGVTYEQVGPTWGSRSCSAARHNRKINQGHQAKYVTFHGNGSGSQIVWHRIDGADTSG